MVWKYKSKLGLRVLAWILVCSTVATIILTIGQLILDYNYGIREIDRRFKDIERSYINGIADALWNIDERLLDVQLSGLVELPDIAMVKIVDKTAIGVTYEKTKKNLAEIKYPYVYSSDIFYTINGKEQQLATMNITADKYGLYLKLFNSVVYILSSHAIKTFIVSLFIMICIYVLVIRRVMAFNFFTNNLLDNGDRLESDSASSTSSSTSHGQYLSEDHYFDELTDMINSVNTLREHLFENITKLKTKEKELFHQATTDKLTGLHNRHSIVDLLDYMIKNARRNRECLAVLYIDLDNFKQINDTQGHDAGDQLLIMVAERFKKTIRSNDVIGRLGGDEFIIILSAIDVATGLDYFLQKLMANFQDPFCYEDLEVHNLNISVGVALFPSDGENREDLFKHADIALYKAKENGRAQYVLFQPQMNDLVVKKHKIISELHKAIENGEFELHYQPIIRCENGGKIACLEALIRWRSPENGLIAPDLFIPVAEENNLIIEIGKYVIDQGLHDIKTWQERFNYKFILAINVSTKQLKDPGFFDYVVGKIDEYQIPPDSIELEITERFLLENDDATLELLRKFRDINVRLSLDDFGTGYSALSYLKKYPFTTLKLDRSFIAELPEDKKNSAISEAIIKISHSLNMMVVAEGVETLGQYDFLTELGTDFIQGYYISRPMDSKQFEQWYIEHQSQFEE